jgi:hypothetical protein
MPKVWSFGCSHSQGTELGVGKYTNVNQWLIDNAGTEYFWSLPPNKRGKIAQEWTKLLEHLYDTTDLETEEKHLSYSGQLAKLLGYELVNKCIRGSGADRALHEIIVNNQKNIDWKNDVVLVGITHIYRWMYDDTVYDGNRNLFWMQYHNNKEFRKAHNTFVKHGPSDFSWSAFNAGIYHLLKLHYPNIILVDTVNITNTFYPGDFLKKICYNDYTLEDFATNQLDRYPQGHYKEYTHEKLAQHIYEKMNNENTK